MRHKIILDCDPGHDDVFAILLAAGNPHLDLLAVTTVAGNQTVEKVTRNALAVCEIAGIDVPVAAGAAHPLVRPQLLAPDIHGDSGLDGPALPACTRTATDQHAVDLLIELVLDNPGEVTLIPTGPLTNIALAMRQEPRIVKCVKRIVLMGGSTARGNVTPAAEFNILADPEAAADVFAADWDLLMVGLDATHQALATPDVVERLSAIEGPLPQFLVEVLAFFRDSYRRSQGFEHPPVHDPCAVAAVIDPAVLTTRPASVTVELTGTWTSGMTVTDFTDLTATNQASRSSGSRAHTTTVATSLDRQRFWDLVLDAVTTHARAAASATT